MAIAKLVSNEAPNKSRTIPKAAKNESVEKVSSTMFTETFLNSVIEMLRGFNENIMRLQESSKKILNSFASLIKSVRELNKDITSRFKTLNADLNASKLEFMRNILTTPITLPSGETVTVAQTKTAEKEKPQEDDNKSIFDFLLDLLPDRAKKAAKGAGKGAANGLRAGWKRGLIGILAGVLGGAALGAAGVETDPDKLKEEGQRKGYSEIVSKKLDEVKHPNKEKLLKANEVPPTPAPPAAARRPTTIPAPPATTPASHAARSSDVRTARPWGYPSYRWYSTACTDRAPIRSPRHSRRLPRRSARRNCPDRRRPSPHNVRSSAIARANDRRSAGTRDRRTAPGPRHGWRCRRSARETGADLWCDRPRLHR